MARLAEANQYESIIAAIDIAENSASDFEKLLEEYRSGSTAYKTQLSKFMAKAQDVNTYDEVQPTIEWAQSLTKIYMDVKLAHRFDAPGCANHTEVDIRVDTTQISLIVLCDSISSKIKYVLDLPLWGEITLHDDYPDWKEYSYQAVGKYHFELHKEIYPGRWPQLHSEEFPKPSHTRLNLELHQKYAKSLLDFGDGDIYMDFPGFDFMQEEHEQQLEKERLKSIPKTGPIPLKKKKKKKKQDKTSKAASDRDE